MTIELNKNRIEALYHLFDDHIAQLNLIKFPSELYQPIDYLLGLKGKRIRPLLTLMVYELFEKKINKDILNVATAIELFHNFTLIHDDIIDQSDYRRGFVTVHKKYGINAGILSGDALLILAYQQLGKIAPYLLQKIFDNFNAIALGICEGQQLDILFESRNNVNLDEYLKMIELKTSILLGLAFQIGGIFAGVKKIEEETLFRIGKNLGIVYQIQDDFLDTYGDFNKFGKPIGNDIWLNKKTFLNVYANSNANTIQLQQLKSLENELNKEKKIQNVILIFNDLGLKQITKDLINRYFETIFEDIDKLKHMTPLNKEYLISFIKTFIYREI